MSDQLDLLQDIDDLQDPEYVHYLEMNEKVEKIQIPLSTQPLLIPEHALCLDTLVESANKVNYQCGFNGHSCGWYIIHYLENVPIYRNAENECCNRICYF